jgi:hypothetical protein
MSRLDGALAWALFLALLAAIELAACALVWVVAP